MTLSLFSIAIIFIVVLAITIEAVRAIHRGRKKTLVTLASILLATFISILITMLLSDLIVQVVMDYALKTLKLDISQFKKTLENIETILFAYFDAIISPILFLFVFIVVRILVSIVVKVICAINANKARESYEPEESPLFMKNPKTVNTLLGVLCGFIISLIIISPIMGTLKVAAKTFDDLNDEKDIFKFTVKEDVVAACDGYSKDLVGNIVYYCGGNLIYKSVATSTLNDNYFGLEREIDNTFYAIGDVFAMNKTLNKINEATPSEKETLKNLGSNVKKAETLKAAAADILPELAKKWLNDEPYQGLAKPKVSGAWENFFDKMLYVCKSSTPDTVGDDLSTLLNVFIIAQENDILGSENYKDMLERAKMTGAFEKIKAELEKNPRMAGLTADIDTMGVKSIASALKNFNSGNYETLMGDITGVLNTAMNLTGQDRLDYITNYTKNYIHQYGINIGDDVAEETAKKLAEEIVDKRTTPISVDELKSFWDKYTVKSTSSQNSVVTPPTTVVPPQTGNTNDTSSSKDPIVETPPAEETPKVEEPESDGEKSELEEDGAGEVTEEGAGEVIEPDGEQGEIL